jgi:hypothetical protein
LLCGVCESGMALNVEAGALRVSDRSLTLGCGAGGHWPRRDLASACQTKGVGAAKHSAHYIWCAYAYQPTTGSVYPKNRNEVSRADFITQKAGRW